MSELKTPGAYVKEVTKFPPSVAQVETAVPVFIGYTDKGPKNELTPIKSLLDYENAFGAAYKESIVLQNTENGGLTLVKPQVNFLMYYSLQMFFANGGGPCYVISVGNYVTDDVVNEVAIGDGTTYGLLNGLLQLDKDDEPTLILFPDATSLPEEDFYAIYQQALNKAAEHNRFVILDTYKGNATEVTDVDGEDLNTIEYFREMIGNSKYGAAYFPHLKTVLNYSFNEDENIIHTGLQAVGVTSAIFYEDEIDAISALRDQAILEIDKVGTTDPDVLASLLSRAIAIAEAIDEVADDKGDMDDKLNEARATLAAIEAHEIDDFPLAFSTEFDSMIEALLARVEASEDFLGDASGKKLSALKTTNSELYHRIQAEIAAWKVTLPPSSAVAGIYAKTDSTAGVWKAPANIGLSYVTATTAKVSNAEQDGYNVDPNGKSINVIRSFSGKGPLVWGARTLDSQDAEWRFIPVRRLFTMIEKSLELATSKFIYEPNDTHTWLRAEAMVENYLYDLWKQGALAGSNPKEAYYVVVSGATTGVPDILAGRMNVEIGLAAVRPAEFIVLNFSHFLQQS
ncbi:MAG: phage tail sheath subtilisin-like domain-containing protein [Flavobacterium sp.]|nr:phage tail sheath subtilisin-like domain-containing protein [Flavobacterium sp.]